MAEKEPGRFAVGDTVRILSVNQRPGSLPDEGVVEKVGRTLVHVRALYSNGKPSANVETYSKADGRRSGRYGHERIVTQDAFAEMQRARTLRDDLTALLGGPRGARIERADRLTTAALEAIRDALAAIPEEERWT